MQKREQFTVSEHLILQPNSLPLKKAERIEVLGPSTNQETNRLYDDDQVCIRHGDYHCPTLWSRRSMV